MTDLKAKWCAVNDALGGGYFRCDRPVVPVGNGHYCAFHGKQSAMSLELELSAAGAEAKQLREELMEAREELEALRRERAEEQRERAEDPAASAPVTASTVLVHCGPIVWLALRADSEEPFGEHWCTPGGKREVFDGVWESPERCALRELAEETGIQEDVSKLYLPGSSERSWWKNRVEHRFTMPDGQLFIVWCFRLELEPDAATPKHLQPNKLQPWRPFNICGDELQHLRLTPATQLCIEQFRQWWTARKETP